MDDKTKKASKPRLNLQAQLAGLAGTVLMMASNRVIRHSSQETREYVKREPIFLESANGSGDPPELQELLDSTSNNYNIGPEDYTATPFNSAHVEKVGDRLKITAFDADDREINYQY
ncbi:hypothetical protein KY315_04015 [Candidatus Woesearchaeota archaeon]|nr:hypothetical protein [Candidatus Woesearchaeota archaeon]